MPNVTLENLTDYARHVLAQAQSSAAHYPLTCKVGLPHLELTTHVSAGALADAFAHGFVTAADNRAPADICRIFVAHPGIDGIAAPARWGQGPFTQHGFATRLAEAGLRGNHFHDLDFWQFYDPQRRVGVQLMASADAFPPWEPGAPLRPFLHWEYAARGMRLAHAGTLGTKGRGVLLAGAGGAGKSGTVAAGLLHGLDSVGDDYVLVDLSNGVTARPLFSTLKQDPQGFARLGLKHRLKAHGPLNWQGKHAFHIDDIAPRPVPETLDIVALVVPHIGGGEASSIVPVSRRDAMIALAPSGIAQMPGERESGFRFFSDLTRLLPCYRLSLGTQPQEIAGTIADFLVRGAS
ncbi:serine kinase [Mesorhizobium sp. M7A.F.Ca.US.006.04.2.1]|uniref:serine kinase n=1 Tax=unclassified Mesorhizobium TaxID=325217 RepID=UPI000FCBE162|nr:MULTISPECIES: serine kinase [unclassified Mesorhizobium]RUX76783.1 serine kinase [Mesorhizobium sp. M7A.F.Ca.US.005.03.1.1]RUY18001.1 serine kinase [Mesorhizobium sp. M7A.F.Ca.US.005.03.2.1]RUY26887.1 serine kinase [Mesorhizobium sp. M7A.F.Ca.US.001.04.2.1]RUY44199.1 serine kinase [Mesorhizobium sp. M7A.F.Ca.US.001.04.1.1]RVA00554.1 serine kinase [Mesorhizobium sp. M7A.F.Ca.US.001.02.1.1]